MLSAPGGPSDEGLILLDEIVDQYPHTKVIMVTGNDNRETALAALQRGAVDWYAKPIELDELKVILRRAFHVRAIEQAPDPGARDARRRHHRLVGESDAIKKVFALVQRGAKTDAPRLIAGGDGPGQD